MWVARMLAAHPAAISISGAIPAAGPTRCNPPGPPRAIARRVAIGKLPCRPPIPSVEPGATQDAASSGVSSSVTERTLHVHPRAQHGELLLARRVDLGRELDVVQGKPGGLGDPLRRPPRPRAAQSHLVPRPAVVEQARRGEARLGA